MTGSDRRPSSVSSHYGTALHSGDPHNYRRTRLAAGPCYVLGKSQHRQVFPMIRGFACWYSKLHWKLYARQTHPNIMTL